MNTIKFEDKNGIKMIAHRGVSGLERENTCPAFVAAGVKSYYGIETDVHVTGDGKYIIHHDDTTTRLTGRELSIGDTDFATLRGLLMTDLDGVTQRADLFMPTPEEYLSICKKYGKRAILELKESMTSDTVKDVVSIVVEQGMFENTTFISFFKENMIYLREAFPTASAQFLVGGSLTEEKISFILENHMDADVYHKLVTKAFVDQMHAAGRVVNVWTVNTLEDAERVAECGVDMITTNILE